MLPHLLSNVNHPNGFTFLSWLVFKDYKILIKEGIKIKNLKFIRDKNGNTPLTYALKRNDKDVINTLLGLISQ